MNITTALLLTILLACMPMQRTAAPCDTQANDLAQRLARIEANLEESIECLDRLKGQELCIGYGTEQR